MKNLFLKYKWWILGYVLYMIVLGGMIGSDNDGEDFVYGILIAYIGVPIVLYILYYVWWYKILEKPHKKEKAQNIIVVNPPQEDKESWPLIEFAKLHGKMKVHFTQGQLDRCYFINEEGTITETYVDRAICQYKVEDIQRERENLSIITLESGDYCLCHPLGDVNL